MIMLIQLLDQTEICLRNGQFNEASALIDLLREHDKKAYSVVG